MVYIYILRCTDDKWYVGKTTKLEKRILFHFRKNGSEWTKKHVPIEVDQVIPGCDDFDVDKYTLQTMSKYGIDNVRGGSLFASHAGEDRAGRHRRVCCRTDTGSSVDCPESQAVETSSSVVMDYVYSHLWCGHKSFLLADRCIRQSTVHR